MTTGARTTTRTLRVRTHHHPGPVLTQHTKTRDLVPQPILNQNTLHRNTTSSIIAPDALRHQQLLTTHTTPTNPLPTNNLLSTIKSPHKAELRHEVTIRPRLMPTTRTTHHPALHLTTAKTVTTTSTNAANHHTQSPFKRTVTPLFKLNLQQFLSLVARHDL